MDELGFGRRFGVVREFLGRVHVPPLLLIPYS